MTILCTQKLKFGAEKIERNLFSQVSNNNPSNYTINTSRVNVESVIFQSQVACTICSKIPFTHEEHIL